MARELLEKPSQRSAPMIQGRDKDFMVLFLHGDLVVLPVQHLDALLDRYVDDATGDLFLGAKGFVLDETAMPAMPAALGAPAPAATARS
jgi:hypothetical protein